MKTVDYLVIGGGVYGCATAWHLARQNHDVLLLEKETLATGASGGIGQRGVRANGRDIRELPLMKLAYELWPTLDEQLQTPVGFQQIGHLQLVERENDLPAARTQVEVQNRFGIPTQWLAPAELRAIEPHFVPNFLGAVYCPHDGTAGQQQTTLAYAHAAQRLGAAFQENTTVERFVSSGNRITSVVTSEQQHIAVRKSVLLLANAGVPALLQEHFDLAIPVWHRHTQVLVLPAREEAPCRHLIGHAHRRIAMKTLPQNRLQISGGWRGRWDEEQQRCLPLPDEVAGNLAAARAVIPSIGDLQPETVDLSRADTECYDKIPIIDTVPGTDNLLFATGWTGHGWAIAPAVASLLAQWAVDNEPPSLLKPFALSRFQT